MKTSNFDVYEIVNGCSTDCVFTGNLDECKSYVREHFNESEFIIINS